MSKKDYHDEIIRALQDLHTLYPNQNTGRHLSMALSEYGDCWAMSDKELLFALQKYSAELDINTVDDSEIQKIIKDGMDLKPLEEDEYGDEEE